MLRLLAVFQASPPARKAEEVDRRHSKGIPQKTTGEIRESLRNSIPAWRRTTHLDRFRGGMFTLVISSWDFCGGNV